MADYFTSDRPAVVEVSEEALRTQVEYVFEAIERARRADNDDLAEIFLMGLVNGLDHVVALVNAVVAINQGNHEVLEEMLKRDEDAPGYMAENAANFRAAVTEVEGG